MRSACLLTRFRGISLLFLLFLVSFLSACSGPAQQRNTEPQKDRFLVGEFETFDPAAFEDTPPPTGFEIVHDVPESLLEEEQKTTERTRPRQILGYRVQVYSSLDRGEATAIMNQVIAWWEGLPEDSNVSHGTKQDMPIYMDYEQPHYKVRVGNYTSRQAAKNAMLEIQDEFSTGFVVQTKVLR
jgi:hypothetical protein